jgi:hypothetical protein
MAIPAAEGLLVVVLLLGATSASADVFPTQCGYDRWQVKILADKDHNKVNFTTIETSVAALVSIPIHEVPYPYDRRIGPEEFNVYRVRARLINVRNEQDGDSHLVLVDMEDQKSQMIAEIPAPECAEGTGHEVDYRKARVDLSRIPVGSIVDIVGVGFFDFLHSSIGQARNGIELHPVLSIGPASQ